MGKSQHFRMPIQKHNGYVPVKHLSPVTIPPLTVSLTGSIARSGELGLPSWPGVKMQVDVAPTLVLVRDLSEGFYFPNLNVWVIRMCSDFSGLG